MEENKENQVEGTYLGTVLNFFEKVGVLAIKVEAPLKVGDKIKIVGGEDTNLEDKVESMQINGKDVKEVKAGEDVGIKVSGKAKKGYKVYRI